MDQESEPPPPSQPYELIAYVPPPTSVPSIRASSSSVGFVDDIDFSEKEYDGGESDNSVECSNCRSTEHNKRKCQLPPKVVQPIDPENQLKKRGRLKGSKNRIGRDDISTPAEYLASLKKTKSTSTTPEQTTQDVQSDQHSSAWLSSVTTNAQRKGKGRGRTSTRGRGKAIGGIGIRYEDSGEVIYRSTMCRPGVVIREPQSQP